MMIDRTRSRQTSSVGCVSWSVAYAPVVVVAAPRLDETTVWSRVTTPCTRSKDEAWKLQTQRRHRLFGLLLFVTPLSIFAWLSADKVKRALDIFIFLSRSYVCSRQDFVLDSWSCMDSSSSRFAGVVIPRALPCRTMNPFKLSTSVFRPDCRSWYIDDLLARFSWIVCSTNASSSFGASLSFNPGFKVCATSETSATICFRKEDDLGWFSRSAFETFQIAVNGLQKQFAACFLHNKTSISIGSMHCAFKLDRSHNSAISGTPPMYVLPNPTCVKCNMSSSGSSWYTP